VSTTNTAPIAGHATKAQSRKTTLWWVSLPMRLWSTAEEAAQIPQDGYPAGRTGRRENAQFVQLRQVSGLSPDERQAITSESGVASRRSRSAPPWIENGATLQRRHPICQLSRSGRRRTVSLCSSWGLRRAPWIENPRDRSRAPSVLAESISRIGPRLRWERSHGTSALPRI
jgi:hypothetical protein